ncbi:MAG: hypothetical protein EB120_03885, partial [Proteobacteria bacterium]|nr:hypothetical protein [Pseudomonadota bacterium]
MRPIGIILIFFGTSLVAHAFPKHCLSSFKKLSPGELRYVAQEFLQKHNTRYSVEIPSTPVSDQCNYGSCWLHARLAHVEEGIKNKTGKTLRINRTFLIAQSLLDRIDDALESPHSPIFQGGNANYADELVRRYGFIPEDPEIWKPRVNFEKAPHGSRLTYFLNARAAQFHEAAKNLTPESRAYLDLQDEARRDMRNILKAYTGPLPRKFEFDGKSYTPKQFSKEIAGNYSPKPLWVYPEVDLLEGNLKRETTIGPVPLPKKVSSSRESLDKIEKRIIQSLQNGQSVTLSYENNTL